MLSFSGSLKVFVAVDLCDMRKGFNGLVAAVTERVANLFSSYFWPKWHHSGRIGLGSE
jgi:hypothetical protein